MANLFQVESLPSYNFPWFGRMSQSLWRILREYIYQRDGGICQYCYEPTKRKDSHCHHTLPLRENLGGGTNHPTNLKILCRECHKKRHPFMLDPLERLRGKVSGSAGKSLDG